MGPSPEEPNGEWLWIEKRMTELLRSDVDRTLFVQGCVRNQVKFYDQSTLSCCSALRPR